MQVETEQLDSRKEGRRAPGLLRNITWLGVANAAVKPLWFLFITAACMRLLGVREYGVLNAALSLTLIATSFVNLGMTRYTVREVARTPSKASRYFSNFMVLRVINSLTAWGGAILIAFILNYEGTALAAVAFGGMYAVALNVAAYCRGIYQALEDLRLEAVMLVIEKILVIGLGLAFLVTTRVAYLTLAGMAAGMTVTTIIHVWWIDRRLARLTLRLFSWRFLKGSIRVMVPFGFAALFTAVYYRVDMVMIEAMIGELPTGQYGAAFRILEALNLLPAVVATAAVYPRLAKLQSSRQIDRFMRLLSRSLWGLVGASILISASLTYLAPLIIHLLDPSPEYVPAVRALQILVWSYPFFCANSLLYAALVSIDDQKFISIFLLAAVVLNVGMNLFMIPTLGINGAAISTVAPEAILTVVYAWRLHNRRQGGALSVWRHESSS